MKKIGFIVILLFNFAALNAQDTRVRKDTVYFGKAYIANPDPDQSRQWCVNTRFELTVLHDGGKLNCIINVGDKKIKGTLSSGINKGKPGKLYSFHPIDKPGSVLFSVFYLVR